MKFMTLVLFAAALNANAAEILSAKLDASKRNILVNLSYFGGCNKHTFSLELGACPEGLPLECSAELIDTIEGEVDNCESLHYETATLPLKKFGLTASKYKKASLIISGDINHGGYVSSAHVRLP